MATVTLSSRNKKVLIQYIKQAAPLYNKHLINKDFIVVCDDFSIYKIHFYRKRFLHLSGLKTSLSEENFFNNALKGIIAESDLHTNQKYNFTTLKKKCSRLAKIDLFLNAHTDTTLLLECLHTNTFDFPIAINNQVLDTCIAFKDNNHMLNGSSLRTSSNSKNAVNTKMIICILSKIKSEEKYTNINYIKNAKLIMNNISDFKDIISIELLEKLSLLK